MGQELLQNDIRYSHDNKPQKQRIQRVDQWFRTEHNLWICSELKSVDSGMELGSLSGIQYYLSNTAKTIRTVTSAQRSRQRIRKAAPVRVASASRKRIAFSRSATFHESSRFRLQWSIHRHSVPDQILAGAFYAMLILVILLQSLSLLCIMRLNNFPRISRGGWNICKLNKEGS